MALRRMILLVSLLVSLSLNGCKTLPEVVLYPIQDKDIYAIPEGAIIEIPEGTILRNLEGKVIKTWEEEQVIENKKSGYFVSSFYMNEVMESKIGK